MLVKRLRLFRARNLMFGNTLTHSTREHEAVIVALGGETQEERAGDSQDRKVSGA